MVVMADDITLPKSEADADSSLKGGPSLKNCINAEAPKLNGLDDEHGNNDNERCKRKAEQKPDNDEDSVPHLKKQKTLPEVETTQTSEKIIQESAAVEETLENTKETSEEKENIENGTAHEGQKRHVELKVPVVKTAEVSKVGSDVLNLSKKPVEALEAQPKIRLNGKSENVKNRSDSPMDLSKAVDLSKPLKAQSEEDIIMLSDDEDNELPKLVNGFREMTSEDLEKTKKVIKKLQEELRNEESKLVLLKKIRQSQVVSQLPDTSSAVPNKPIPQVTQSTNRPVHVQHQQQVKGNQQPAHAHSNKTLNISHQSQRGPQQPAHANHVNANRHSSSQSGTPMSLAHQNAQHSTQTSRSSGSGHVSGYRSHQQAQVSSKPSQPEQTPAQRQAAAKLALRKQLEKTLLQIPPPKPPPPEMNFIPSSGSGDFVPLVGLEEVVKFIVEVDARVKGGKAAEVKYVFNPFTCVQCGTDFTPVWKRDKPGSKNVICEQCVTSNQKKALKQEHTNRLKSAFVKALQQEQEIEQRMQQAEKSVAHSSAQQTQQSSTTAQHSSSQKQTTTSHHSTQPSPAHSSSSHSSSTQRSAHSNSSTSSTANYKATQEQIRQHQNLLQAHQQQLRSLGLAGLQNFAPHLAFPFQPQLTPKQAAELQRQYLLDMIQPRSVPGGNIWRK